MTRYMLLIYADESGYADVTPEQWGQMAAEHGVFAKEAIAHGGRIISGEGLMPTSTATTVRGDGAGGHTVTDGPFVETKEACSTLIVLSCCSLR
ncbi:MAG: YciI family protein [Pseudonocardia sp.]|nr:YciI family protein [Pseudonocardia sp.]